MKVGSISSMHCFKIFKPQATCLLQHQFFSLTVIDDWNALPEDTVNADFTDLCKTYLDRFFYDHHDII